MKKSSFLNILRAIRAGRCRERRYADHIFIEIYFRAHNAPFRSQIFKKIFALGSKGGIDPLTQILQISPPRFTLVPPGGRTPPLEVRESRTRGTVELYETSQSHYWVGCRSAFVFIGFVRLCDTSWLTDSQLLSRSFLVILCYTWRSDRELRLSSFSSCRFGCRFYS